MLKRRMAAVTALHHSCITTQRPVGLVPVGTACRSWFYGTNRKDQVHRTAARLLQYHIQVHKLLTTLWFSLFKNFIAEAITIYGVTTWKSKPCMHLTTYYAQIPMQASSTYAIPTKKHTPASTVAESYSPLPPQPFDSTTKPAPL